MRRARFLAAAGLAFVLPGLLGAGAAGGLSWIPTPTGALAYERFGSGERQLVVLSGGPGIDPEIMRPVVNFLAGSSEVILFHQRGTGASWDAAGDEAALTVAGFVADLEALRLALGRATLNLVGQSWGSMLSMAYAAAHRPQVASLALLNPGGPNLAFMRGFSRRIVAKLTPEERAKLRSSDAISPEHLAIEVLGDVHERANVAPFVASIGPRTANPRVFRALMRDASQHYDVRAALDGIDVPTFLLFGDDDPSLAAKDQLTALFPRARVAVLADAGHLGWLDQPQAYRAAVLSFVEALPA
jgi:proline iminopeptidase